MVEKRWCTRASAVSSRAVAQVLEIIAELGREQHALVDERARRQRHWIKARGAPIGQVEDVIRDDLAQDIDAPLERVLIGDSRAAADEDLAMDGLGRLDAFAESRGIDRHVAPAEKELAFVGDDFLDDPFDDLAAFEIARQEQGADRIMARLR